jgi:hypothetical protein
MDIHQQKYFQEIVLLLTRLLPFCEDPKAVTDLGKRLMRTDGASRMGFIIVDKVVCVLRT